MGLAVFQDAITEPSAVRAVKDSSSDPSGSSWATRAAAARTVKWPSITGIVASTAAFRNASRWACAVTVRISPLYWVHCLSCSIETEGGTGCWPGALLPSATEESRRPSFRSRQSESETLQPPLETSKNPSKESPSGTMLKDFWWTESPELADCFQVRSTCRPSWKDSLRFWGIPGHSAM